MKAPVIECGDFPSAPDAFAFAEPAIEHVMRPRIRLCPPAFQCGGVVSTVDDEPANVVYAGASDLAIGEGQVQFHLMFIAWVVVVKANPRPRREQFVSHDNSVPGFLCRVKSQGNLRTVAVEVGSVL